MLCFETQLSASPDENQAGSAPRSSCKLATVTATLSLTGPRCSGARETGQGRARTRQAHRPHTLGAFHVSTDRAFLASTAGEKQGEEIRYPGVFGHPNEVDRGLIGRWKRFASLTLA